jgi:phage shock protein E
MLQTIKNLFGFSSKVDYIELTKQGATIVDVRTKAEFNSGHIPSSVNIPLQTLQSQLNKINKDKPVITCCASGMRSASAKGILKANGFKEVHNGGGWMSLYNKIK